MEISIDNESKRFFRFLQEENNDNIIFSGIYGIGKSFFINDFFNKKHTDKYITLFLTPVNYSVASNEDIFEYIKIDVLFQLLNKVSCDLKNVQISNSVATYYYIKNNLNTLIGNILSSIEKVCLKTDIIPQLIKLKKNIQEFQKKESTQEDKEVESFIQDIIQRQGSIYERNIVTQIIQSLITNAKKEEKKEIVLVIDDLDRIDPEHIFRILNILSVHDDFCCTKEHKFKIDKTILVCDVENIRRIFHAKYGSDVDFSGYIDKFYSKEVFHFHNEDEIQKCIADQILKIKSKTGDFQDDRYAYKGLEFILQYLIKYGYVNIRTLERFMFDYSIEDKTVRFNDMVFAVVNSPALIVFEFLKRVLGSSENLRSKLSGISFNKIYGNCDYVDILELFIIFADLPNSLLGNEKQENSYKGIRYIIGANKRNLIANIDYEKLSNYRVDCFSFLYDAYLNYEKYFM
ncbi:hypothetical protein EAJ14_03660 [Parabacteroides distasonis]|jgi:hypothetical protein|uniref:KAP NTPase domain-containing protein n=1 Tax=Parabacteroides distasonis TaxID=823 RepID=A0A5Q8BEY9_PARDI|nr:P-loop NTPase fold protein [Parabacteroides distasonis]MRY06770.1 hypothetical protein [Parabacteroides distasonis]MRY57888.1 hypothetical protein [Parabacteroides distasonis]MRY66295.1 hypothetical protein [Parabacteroides distasonis]MRZ63209.1 hypothetical protein [Parabacteroides distasonis]MSA31146.1 hypothetical protein [Parabacteroides distasonis]